LAQAGLISGDYFIVGVSLLTGLLTLYVVGKVWLQVFLKNKPEENPSSVSKDREKYFVAQHKGMYLTILVLVLVVLSMSFYAEPFIRWSETAANHLLDRRMYIESVLGK
jgi:multicomponent Na+:H+ antiporter subunit D